MLIVHVQVHVKPEGVEAFKAATLENAAASLREPGIARFDVIQAEDDATRFVLVEVYRDADAPRLHKDTPHYAKWRDQVAELMASPRTSARYSNVFPGEGGWQTPSRAG
jgi:quinol monooxygenase YgiN